MTILEATKLLDEVIGLKSIRSIRGGKYREYIRIAVPVFASVQMCVVILLTFMNFALNVNVDIVKALPSFGPSLCYFMLTAEYWHLLFNRAKFYLLFDDIQAIVNERKQLNGNNDLYTHTQQRVQWLNKHFSLVFAALLICPFPLVIVAYHLCIGDYSIDSWLLVFPIWTPFKTNALSNTFSVVFQTTSAVLAVIVSFTILSIFGEVALYTKTFMLDIKFMFNHVDRLTKSKKKSDELLVLDCCKEAVDLHEKVFRCLHQFSDVANCIVLVTVVPMVLAICVSLLIVHKHWQTASAPEICCSIILVVLASLVLFSIFFFGQKMQSDLMALSDMIYQSEWDRYPRSVRRFMVLMMMLAQKPFYLSAYGLFRCTLENYVGVIQWIYSVFMLLRALD